MKTARYIGPVDSITININAFIMMDDIRTPKPWKDKKAALKAQFPDLTEADLTYSGDVDELIRSIQHRIGKSHAEVKRLIMRL